jgi:rhodanese-related sulfurtransferase
MSVSNEGFADIEITPSGAWKMLAEGKYAKLVDVRTGPEWAYVGSPDLVAIDKKIVKLSWHIFPEMKVNESLIRELRLATDPADVLFFICRSGGRSLAAAKASIEAGFRVCYSITGGFEGAVDPEGHRGAIEGWKFGGLPWKQP